MNTGVLIYTQVNTQLYRSTGTNIKAMAGNAGHLRFTICAPAVVARMRNIQRTDGIALSLGYLSQLMSFLIIFPLCHSLVPFVPLFLLALSVPQPVYRGRNGFDCDLLTAVRVMCSVPS